MRRARTIIQLGFAGAVLVAVILLVSARDLILVEWHLHQLGSEDWARREQAARELGSLRSVKSVPYLVQALREGRISEKVGAAALIRIGEPAVDALMEMLTDGRRRLRGLATETLLQIRPEEHESVAGLLRELARRHSQQTIWGLADVEAPPEAAVAALVGTMRDKEFGYRWMAASALGRMGPRAANAIPFLVEALKDENAGLGGHAALALARIGESRPKQVIPALREVPSRRSSSVSMRLQRKIAGVPPLRPPVSWTPSARSRSRESS